MEINEQVKGLARDIFGMGGLCLEVLMKQKRGGPAVNDKNPRWKKRRDKLCRSFERAGKHVLKILPAEATDIKILFKKKGHLYDVREKKYIGEISGNKQIEATIFPAKAKIYAILPYRVNGIEATLGKKKLQSGRGYSGICQSENIRRTSG